MEQQALPVLSQAQARVLGVLIEKQHTVPDSYPLTLNSLQAGCNQKSSRDPVLQLSEGEVQQAVNELRQLGLVEEIFGNRAMRYAHHLGRALALPSQSVAILAVLLLRGAQTPGELRTNCERLHRFSDISALEGFLDELAERAAGALVVCLPRQPGAREARWMHCLQGEPQQALDEVATLRARVAELEAQLAQAHAELAQYRG